MTQPARDPNDALARSIETMEHENLGQMVKILVALSKNRRQGLSSDEIAEAMTEERLEVPGGGPWTGETVDRVLAIVDDVREQRRTNASRSVLEPSATPPPTASPTDSADGAAGSRTSGDGASGDGRSVKPRRRRGRKLVGVVAAVLLFGAGVVLSDRIMSRSDEADTAAPAESADSADSAEPAERVGPVGVSAPEVDPEDESDMMSIRIEPPVTPGDVPPATATIKADGLLHVEGAFASQEAADTFIAGAAEVFGQENIVEAYDIDPAAPEASVSDVGLDKPVLFETGSAVIDPEFIPFLEACGDVLKLNPHIVISVAGFTDSVGDADFNLRLSQERAEAILDFYRDLDISSDQLLGTGFGETEFVADNDTDEGRSQNRRATLTLLNAIREDIAEIDEDN